MDDTALETLAGGMQFNLCGSNPTITRARGNGCTRTPRGFGAGVIGRRLDLYGLTLMGVREVGSTSKVAPH
jgi:hypothetical protein